MGIIIENGLFSTEISHSEIDNIVSNKIPPLMRLWQIIKDFFCYTKKADVLDYLEQLCHPDHNTDGMGDGRNSQQHRKSV